MRPVAHVELHLRHVTDSVPLPSQTLQEDEPQQPEEKAAVVATRSGRKTGRKTAAGRAADDDGRHAASDDDSDHGSVCAPARTPAQRRNRFCAVCETTESTKWWFCPDNICELEVKPNPVVMCDQCGVRWRHCASFLHFAPLLGMRAC